MNTRAYDTESHHSEVLLQFWNLNHDSSGKSLSLVEPEYFGANFLELLKIYYRAENSMYFSTHIIGANIFEISKNLDYKKFLKLQTKYLIFG